MLTYPHIDPVIIALGPLKVHWYGVMYLVAFLAAYWLGLRRAQAAGLDPAKMESIVFNGALGVLLGGRIGYVLFYSFDNFIANPLMLIRIWDGGMSFHGGLIGVMLAMWITARQLGWRYFRLMDFVAPLVPIGLGAGRLGNFINGELWGRPTDLPWGMLFPFVDAQPRHPSMLYEMLLEGVVLFTLVWWFSAKSRPMFAVSGLFALGYGLFRFLVEFVREPDAQLGFIAFDWLTMGMLLSLPLVLVGLVLLGLAYLRDRTPRAA